MSTPSKKTNSKSESAKPSTTPAKKPSKPPAGGVSKEESLSNLAAIMALEKCEKKKKRIELIMKRIQEIG